MRLNEAQQSSIKLLSGERSELRSASEASPFSFKRFSASLGKAAHTSEASPFNAKESVGICRNVLGSSGIVPKLFKSEARFPFFVRQVSAVHH